MFYKKITWSLAILMMGLEACHTGMRLSASESGSQTLSGDFENTGQAGDYSGGTLAQTEGGKSIIQKVGNPIPQTSQTSQSGRFEIR